jgi:thiol-disulfide isomerase/thioredoxin
LRLSQALEIDLNGIAHWMVDFRSKRGGIHLILLLLVVPKFNLARQEDERSKFLYINNPEAKEVVFDYQSHMHAPHFVLEEISEKHRQFSEKLHELNSTEHSVQPFFLREDYPIPRIVQFYSPWCGHCQQFAPRYISIAKDVLGRIPRYHLEFYAVSCSEHHALCMAETIHSYPTIRAYNAYEKESTQLKTFTSASIDKILNLGLIKQGLSLSDNEEEETATDGKLVPKLDILGATSDSYRHTRTDVYRDAALSFTYSLQNHIFEEGQLNLTSKQADALREWLDLLYWTLPPTWMVHALINDLRRNFNEIVHNKALLLQLVKIHQPVVHDKKDMQWSQGCRHGDGLVESFSCGLWGLFHIASVGVPEQHHSVLGHRHRISTKHAAETLKDYITHFFGWCPQCREEFLQLYNSCAYGHCRRFRQSKGKKTPPDRTWQEFPVWLWQIHNDINVKLVTKSIEKAHKRAPTDAELEKARWPQRSVCHLCYNKKGSIGKASHVYDFLKDEYWPSGIFNRRFMVLDKGAAADISRYSIFLDLMYGISLAVFPDQVNVIAVAGAVFGVIVLLLVLFLLRTFSNRLKMRRIKHTGRHKKYDINPLFDP